MSCRGEVLLHYDVEGLRLGEPEGGGGGGGGGFLALGLAPVRVPFAAAKGPVFTQLFSLFLFAIFSKNHPKTQKQLFS